jgi:asparagine synthase (glutamine-hydrolysing)
MCGIAGLVGKKRLSQEVKQSFINASRLMDHRGPDYFGVFEEDNVLLVHLRLSIIDLDSRSNQPFKLTESEAIGVYNGELYNFRDIQNKYEISCTTSSDTEVLLKSFLKQGIQAVKDWNGIFATAIYKTDTGELTLIRDRYGVKPLYLYICDNFIIFASEAKVIMEWLPEFSLREDGISQFLWFGNTIDGGSMINNIRKVNPATILTFDTKNFEKKNEVCYWQNPGTQEKYYKESELVEELRLKLGKAVERQLVSDVPIGFLLSGGIDSSAILAFASRHLSNLDVYSVLYDYNISGKSEIDKARQVAKKFGANFNELLVEAKDIVGDLEALIFQYDEPFGDAGSIPLYQLSKECGKGLKVILQGDGGDEFFAGYRRYNLLNAYHFWKWTSYLISPFIQGKYKERLKRLSFVLGQPDDGKLMAQFLTQEVPYKSPYNILNTSFRERIESKDPYGQFHVLADKYKNENRVQKMLFTDVEILLPNTFLEKVDKATMKCSIEARVPFLDNDLTSFVLGLPSRYKVRKGDKKYLLKKALQGIVPDEILDAPKRGFDVPYSQWLRTDLYDYAKSSFEIKAVEKWLDLEQLQRLLEIHKVGKINYGPILWKCLILSRWLNKYSSKIID